MVAATDSEDSSLQVGPPRQAASPQPTRPSPVSRRTKTKFIISRVVKDILWGRSTGMSAWITRTSAIFIVPHYPCCEDGRQVRYGRSRWRDHRPPRAPSRSRPTRAATSKSEIANESATRSLLALATQREIQGKAPADALWSREAFYVDEEVFAELFETLGG